MCGGVNGAQHSNYKLMWEKRLNRFRSESFFANQPSMHRLLLQWPCRVVVERVIAGSLPLDDTYEPIPK